ncbi:MAG: glycoside hydrolase family 5 protein [Acidobacteriota bacterium]
MRLTSRSFAFLVACFVLGALSAAAQDRAAELKTAFARAQHLRHGINASEWFAQSADDYSARRTNSYMDDGDIALMAKLGFDNVRLSIDPVPLEQGLNHRGQYADFVTRLDHVVDTMVAHGLAVQIDIHPEEAFKQQVKNSNEGVERFVMLWRRLAAHYADRNPDLIYYEIMNEPEVNDPYRWAGIQARAAAAIREVAPKNTIIATGPNWSSIADLLTQHPLPDGNVIYNFHFYEPHEFTHQGASWGNPYWIYTHNIAYPPDTSAMQQDLAEVPDARDRYDFEHYWLDGWSAQRIKLQMDAAAAWAKTNDVPLICNEFGVFRNAPQDSRMRWLHDVRTAMEADGIGWTMWDYRGGFGVVWKQNGQPAKVDEKVVEALGLKK